MIRGKKTEHCANRNMRGFETHRRAATGAAKKAEHAWRFYDFSRLYADPAEPHLRTVARTFALPTKHVRTMEEPSRATHGRDSQ